MRTARFVLLALAAMLACPIFAANAQAGTAGVANPAQVAGQHSVAAEVWQMQNSGTTAGLRGIHSVDGQIAWASGTGGTVLRTTDGGAHWQHCAMPDADKDGATLDFRGVQAWDADTAIVMASGPGDKSRLYKTTDGCKTWRLLLKNNDPNGFFDAVSLPQETYGDAKVPGYVFVVGDPINGRFDARDGSISMPGLNWDPVLNPCEARRGEALFAASNSSISVSAFESYIIATGGIEGGRIVISPLRQHDLKKPCLSVEVPMTKGSESSGIFSIGFTNAVAPWYGIAVGGDYTKPNDSTGTAAYTVDGGQHWTASTTPPHGYRSTVQYSENEKAWFTAGTNGSDISHDDGRTWQPLDNGTWNALSLPFIVGPAGRIARLNSAAIPKP